jgi:hypothetical protein
VNRKPEDSGKKGGSIPDSLKAALAAGVKAVKITRKQGWKRYIPLFLMCMVINCCPQILHTNWVGYLHFILTTFFLIVLKGIFVIFPLIYFRESARLATGEEPRPKLPPELVVILRSIEGYLVPTIAFMITAAWSPENASYASAVTLLSGALAVGLGEGLIDLKTQEQASRS